MAAFWAVLLVAQPTFGLQSAQAQGPCDTRESVLVHLAQKYKENPVSVGVTNRGSLVEVLTNPRGDTWTIIVTSPEGMSCLVLSGEGWRGIEQVAREPEA